MVPPENLPLATRRTTRPFGVLRGGRGELRPRHATPAPAPCRSWRRGDDLPLRRGAGDPPAGYCSRIRLRDAAAVGTLAGLLLPADENASAAAAHQLLWSLFTAIGADAGNAEVAQHAQRQRPAANFLWRDEGDEGWRRRRFLTLSAQPPDDRLRLFDVESKEFAPRLSVGQQLRFCLRANPSVSEPVRGAQARQAQGGAADRQGLALLREHSRRA